MLDFIVKAIEFVSLYGWTFLPFYEFDPETINWKHSKFSATPNSLSSIKLLAHQLGPENTVSSPLLKESKSRFLYQRVLKEAKNHLDWVV